MNEKLAKQLRRSLLPNPRWHVAVSRGTVMRGTTEYEVVRFNPHKPNGSLRVKGGTPRGAYLRLKKKVKKEGLV